MQFRFKTLALAALAVLGGSGCVAQEVSKFDIKPGTYPLHVYVTSGDNLTVNDWPPVDSPATIAAQFEKLQKTYHVSRVYWRGEALRIRTNWFKIRKENVPYYDLWMWTKHELDDVKVNESAVSEAHNRGMEIFMAEGVNDHGAPGDTAGSGYFPFQLQDSLSMIHPEWVLVDRWGERSNAGCLEFAYPDCRKALIDRYMGLMNTYNYDGMYIYTYAENWGSTYDEEYGFNDPIVNEYKRRYNVDIRTQPFDKEKWYALRGEYFTQFLKELHSAMAAKGKKLTVAVFPRKPETASPWPIATENPRAQMAKMDWQNWLNQDAVDELATGTGGDPTALFKQIKAHPKGRNIPTELMAGSWHLKGYKPLYDAGARGIPTLMPGGGVDPYALVSPSAGLLKSGDWLERAQGLLYVQSGGVSASSADVAALVSDPNVLVRREAVRTLAKQKATDQVGVIEGALNDPEVSVRIAACEALKLVNGSESANKILAALKPDSGWQLKTGAYNALNAMRPGILPILYSGLKSPIEDVRETCAHALELDTSLPTTNALVDAAKNDADYRVRYYAMRAVGNRRNGDAFNTLMAGLKDPDDTVQLIAVKSLSNYAPGGAQKDQILSALEDFWKGYGKDSQRPDRDWGWLIVGNTLNAYPDGRAILEKYRTGKDDPYLAWYAYEVVYHPVTNPQGPSLTTEADAVSKHQQYAPPYPGRRVVP